MTTSRPRSTWRSTAARISASTISSSAPSPAGARLEQARRAQQAPDDLGASGLARRVHTADLLRKPDSSATGRSRRAATVPFVLVDAWLPRAAARHPDRPAVNAMTYAELLGEVDATARRLAGRGVRAGDRVGIALAPGEGFCIALHAMPAPGGGRRPGRPAPRGARARARASRARPRSSTGRSIATPASEARLRDRHDLDAPAIVVHTSGTSGTPKAVELTYGNWLWSALGSAVALGLDPAERWLCALPLSHVGGLSIVMRSAIYATTAIVHERFDTDRVLDALMDDGRADDRLARPHDAAAPARRRACASRRRCAGRCSGARRATTALQGRAAAAGVPVAPTYGLTEACSQVTTLGAPLFCTRVRDGRRRRDPRQRADGRGVGGIGSPGARHRRPGRVAPGRRAARRRAQGRHDHLRRRERRAGRGRGGARGASRRRRGRRPRPRATRSGARRSSPPSSAAPDVEAEELRAWCAARLATFKVPKEIAFAVALPRTPSGKVGAAAKRPAMIEADEPRDELLARWDTMAAGWKATRAELPARDGAGLAVAGGGDPPAAGPHACSSWPPGLGDTGLLAAQLVAPGGSVLITDGAENDGRGRARACRGGRRDERRTTDHAGRVDRPPDGVASTPCICRFGYMLLVDPEAALRETRRVLKPGGRVALAVWDDLERNPWMKVLREALVERGLAPDGRARRARGRSRSAREDAVAELLATAGFEDIEVRAAGPRRRRRRASTRGGITSCRPRSPRPSSSAAWRPRSTTNCVISSMRGTPPTCATTDRVEVPARALVAAAAA